MLDRYPGRLDDLRAKSLVSSKRLLADEAVISAGLHDGYNSEERGKLTLVAETADVINFRQQTHGYNCSDTRDGNQVLILPAVFVRVCQDPDLSVHVEDACPKVKQFLYQQVERDAGI